MSDVLKVDVWSDIACPWCYVGKRRFADGVQQYVEAGGTRTVEVEYHSFELAPDTPVDFAGTEVDFLVDFKHMPADRVRQMLGQMTGIAAGEGLAYDFGKLQHTKTLKAHELLHHAKGFGLQEAMKERLLRAYFVEGRHIGHIDDLADLAAEVGMHRDDVVAALTDGRHAAAVQADIEQAIAYGISGVPFYVIDGRLGVSGAQTPDVFAQALTKADG
jgi:predicted DsbA family dithiol-disulfide isomerase